MTSRGHRSIIASAAAIAAALVVAGNGLAHGGETTFIAEPTQVTPGGGVHVQADLVTAGPVELALIRSDGLHVAVGKVSEVDQGHFDVMLTIPTDLPVGAWTLKAVAEGQIIASTTIEVSGGPVDAEAGGQGARDDDDALLVPLPSGWQRPLGAAPVAAGSGPVSTDWLVDPSMAALLVGTGLLLLLRRAGRSRWANSMRSSEDS